MNPFKLFIIKLLRINERTLLAGFEVLEKEKIIVEILKGDISVKNLKDYKIQQAANKHFNPKYTIISDERACNFEGIIWEVDEYVEFLETQVHRITDKRKVISLVKTKNQQRFLNFYKNKQQRLLQELQLFTSVEDGLDWIGKLEYAPAVKAALERLGKSLKPYS